jgi:hypothetical protein
MLAPLHLALSNIIFHRPILHLLDKDEKCMHRLLDSQSLHEVLSELE